MGIVKATTRLLFMNKYVEDVCKIGQGSLCCKYLVFGTGFECMKLDPVNKATIDSMWNSDKIAQGDNCEGKQLSLFETTKN